MSPLVRSTISLLVIAASGVVMVATARLRPPPPPPSRVESVFAVPADAVRAIALRTWQGSVRAARRDGAWRVEEFSLHEPMPPDREVRAPDPIRVDEEIAALVRTVVALPEVDRFPLDAPLSAFGLDDPQATVALSLEDGSTVMLEIGGRTPMGDGLYARVPATGEVLRIGGLILHEIGAALFSLRGLAGG